MIPYIETFQSVLKRIESEKIPYIIVGSIAAMVYGEPRVTRDLDLVLDIKPQDAAQFLSLFQQPEYYCPPMEILGDEIRNRGQFNLLHVNTGLKVDIVVKKLSPFDESRFQRRQQIELWEGFSAWLASAEDVIIKKLEYYREGKSEKHLRDIRGMLTNTEVDKIYLNKWVTSLGHQVQWDQI